MTGCDDGTGKPYTTAVDLTADEPNVELTAHFGAAHAPASIQTAAVQPNFS